MILHQIEPIGLGNGGQSQMHFHQGKGFTDTNSRALAEREIGKAMLA